MFFPFAFTSFNSGELCNVVDQLASYNTPIAGVLGIRSCFEKYKKDEHSIFEVLCDFNKEVSESYGVLYDTFPAFGMKGVSKRATFLIDGDGVVQYVEVCSSPDDQPKFSVILSKLNELSVNVE